MASVFLSYDREDAETGRRVARALEDAGHSVWWDQRIKSGAQFAREIDQALKRADAVVVLWSEKSIESAWVRDEAATGRDAGKLVPARIDAVDPPLGFRQYQTTDLTRWKGRRTAQLNSMLEAIAVLDGHSRQPVARTELDPPQPDRRSRHGRHLIVAAAILAVASAALVAWALISRSSSIPVVAVAAADASPTSQALARDLLVKLGTLQTSQRESIDLVSNDDTAKKPALVFQVGRSGRGQGAEANLALTDAKDRSQLWAKDIRDPEGNEADLRQQLAYVAAHVLRCALETMHPSAGRLTRQSVKTYLTACAPMSEASQADLVASIAALRELVRDEPRFSGGWAKLLLAETAVATDPIAPEGAAMQRVLRRHIVESKRLHPGLAAAYVAEDALTPGSQFLARDRLLDQGIERNPDSPELRSARHLFNANVGRVEDSLRDARRAMELDPLSPDTRSGFILSLAFAGRQDEALAELAEAERLWPGATSLGVARYNLHNRTGDPREALRLLRAGVLGDAFTEWIRPQKSLLEARIDRSQEKVEAAVQDARAIYNRYPNGISLLAQALVELDREEELFPILLNWQRMDIVTWVTEVLFRPKFSDFHKDPRFMQVAKRLGLLDYWRATGKWPDFCSRNDLPYDCQAEAARLAS